MMSQSAGGATRISLGERVFRFIEPYLYLFPALGLIIVFKYYPFVKTISMSAFLVNANGLPVEFVGLENYIGLFKDPRFLQSIGNTFKYVVCVVPLTIVLAYALALLANKKRRVSRLYETMFSLPMAISMSVAALIFQLLLNPNIGAVNYILNISVRWFTDARYALTAIMIIGIWMGIGMDFLFLLSAVRNVPEELLECAAIEGAGTCRKIIHIYLPITSPTLFFLLCTNLAGAMMMSDLVIILTNGGPGNATSTIMYYMYNKAFYLYSYGSSYAAAVVGFIIAFILILINFRFEKKGVHYS
jgi:sn-glycerol 3-phosphate transport system permease protein